MESREKESLSHRNRELNGGCLGRWRNGKAITPVFLKFFSFFSIKHFTLVNIIEGKQVIKECIANEFTVDKVSAELNRLLHDEDYKKEMLASYQHLYSLLGDSPAAATAASIITAKR